jgi:hypothetical protein
MTYDKADPEPKISKVERINLNVPFQEKDQAKSLGARWDPHLKTWYIDSDKDLKLFTKWM